MPTTNDLDTKLRARAYRDFCDKVDIAFKRFMDTVREASNGGYSDVLNKQGIPMRDALKQEKRAQVEQAGVDDFLKKFDDFGLAIDELYDRTHGG